MQSLTNKLYKKFLKHYDVILQKNTNARHIYVKTRMFFKQTNRNYKTLLGDYNKVLWLNPNLKLKLTELYQIFFDMSTSRHKLALFV